MFKNCNYWCRWHGYCTNTTNGECAGLSLPDEQAKDEACEVMNNAKRGIL